MDGFLIGRFQPFHLGHLEALRFALSRVDRLYLGLGSSNRPVQKANPFSARERKRMILDSVDNAMRQRMEIFFIPDLDDHQKWVEQIDGIVPGFDLVFTNDALTRHIYSRRRVDVVAIPFTDRGSLSGTHIRNLMASDSAWEHLVPAGTRKFLNSVDAADRLRNL